MSITTNPNDPDLKKIKDNGQQEKYLVLSEEERSKGFVRPVRTRYKHLACGAITSMALALSQTYARDPKFYGGTFCGNCGRHFSLKEPKNPAFVWYPDGDPVGSTEEEAKEYLLEQKLKEAILDIGSGI